jgi:short subunit fatty acids transporter
MDKSMERIDIIKLLIFLMVFIVITLSMILFLIIPNVKDYRASKSIHKKAVVHKMRVQSVLDEREAEHAKLKEENRRSITAFMHKFSSENFMVYAKKFFDDVELKETNFYLFLEGLNRYENVIQADFPIHMESNESKISSSFTIRVYELH